MGKEQINKYLWVQNAHKDDWVVSNSIMQALEGEEIAIYGDGSRPGHTSISMIR